MGKAQTRLAGLKKRREFLAVAAYAAAHQTKVVTTSMVVQGSLRPPPDSIPDLARVGFTVTKKTGKAVVRNRIKRRLRAAARETLPLLPCGGWDYVFIGRSLALDAPYDVLCRDMSYAVRRLVKQRASGTSATQKANGGVDD